MLINNQGELIYMSHVFRKRTKWKLYLLYSVLVGFVLWVLFYLVTSFCAAAYALVEFRSFADFEQYGKVWYAGSIFGCSFFAILVFILALCFDAKSLVKKCAAPEVSGNV